MHIEEIEKYIGSVKWKDSKTYKAFAPHEYTIKHWDSSLENDFIKFVEFIRIEGKEEKYFTKSHIYYYLGEYKYWTMGDAIEDTYVLNRCLIIDYPNNIYIKINKRWRNHD